MTEATLRKCCACSTSKPLDEFHRYARANDGSGRQYKCRSCCAEYQRQYNETHGAERAKRRADQALANADRDALAKRAWMDANPDKLYALRVRRRALERAARINAPIDLAALWTGVCGICGSVMDRDLPYPDPMSKSIDHILPIVRGGEHVQANLQYAHLRCNMAKGSRIIPQG